TGWSKGGAVQTRTTARRSASGTWRHPRRCAPGPTTSTCSRTAAPDADPASASRPSSCPISCSARALGREVSARQTLACGCGPGKRPRKQVAMSHGVRSRAGEADGPVLHVVTAARRRGAETFAVDLAEARSEEHTSELQSRENLVCRLLLEKKKERITKCENQGRNDA